VLFGILFELCFSFPQTPEGNTVSVTTGKSWCDDYLAVHTDRKYILDDEPAPMTKDSENLMQVKRDAGMIFPRAPRYTQGMHR